MLHFALIGEKLGHSLSVPIHEALYAMLGIDADYRLVPIPKESFDEDVRALMGEVDGFNITIPYKQRIMPLLGGLDARAEAVGAVNTVAMREGARGYNTDVPGFRDMLLHHGMDPRGLPCFCLGTGGASRAVRAALAELGAASVTMVSRHPEGEEIGYDALPERFEGLLVNCTPAGMFPHAEGCPVPDELLDAVLSRARGVADLIYNPAETRLTLAAKAHGVPACTGLYMLVAQAVEAERIWLGRDLPADLTARILPLIHG